MDDNRNGYPGQNPNPQDPQWNPQQNPQWINPQNNLGEDQQYPNVQYQNGYYNNTPPEQHVQPNGYWQGYEYQIEPLYQQQSQQGEYYKHDQHSTLSEQNTSYIALNATSKVDEPSQEKKKKGTIVFAIVFAVIAIVATVLFAVIGVNSTHDTSNGSEISGDDLYSDGNTDNNETDNPSHIHRASNPIIESEISATCTLDGNYESVVYCIDCECEISREMVFVKAFGHNFNGNKCSKCGELKESDGLGFILSDDKTHYIVFQVGTCKDTDIVIPREHNGLPVKKIEDRAFYDCSHLTSVTVPESITNIGSSAFSGCSSLENLVLPFVGESKKTTHNTYQYPFGYIFGTSSYTNATATEQHYYGSSTSNKTYDIYYIPLSLKSVTISGGNILCGAFQNCTSLKNITISDSVTFIGDNAFDGCSNIAFNEYENACYIGNESNPYHALVKPKNEEIEYCTIHSNTLVLANGAFKNCSLLADITIPNRTIYIGNDAFYGCQITSATCPIHAISSISKDHLQVLTINGGDTIENKMFHGYSSLVIVTMCDSIISIGSEAFSGCLKLTNVTIPDSVTSIGDNAFDGCNNIAFNEYENACYIGNESNPYHALVKPKNEEITSCTIHSNTLVLADGAFKNYSLLANITIPNSTIYIGNDAFYGCQITSATCPIHAISSISKDYLQTLTINGGNTIENKMFHGYSSLVIVTMCDSIISIGSEAFSGCSKLTNVTIPDSVTSIGDNTFYDCSSLTSIAIPDSVTSIGDSAFSGCSKLTNVIIPDSVTSIGDSAFYGCKKLTFNQYENAYYIGNENNLYHVLVKPRVAYINSCIINDNTTIIADGAFGNCKSLKSITIPDSVTSIGDDAFENCSSLTSVTIGDSVTSIGGGAFYGCSILTNVTIPSSVTSIGIAAFESCTSLRSVTIGDSVTSIGEGAFHRCTSLTSVTIPDSVTSIGDRAFGDCTSLRSVTIGDGATYIGDDAFRRCTSLTSVTIGNSVTSIGDGAFSGCSRLTNITIPSSVTSIGNGAFYNCNHLAFNRYDNTYYLGNKDNPYHALIESNSDRTSCTIHNDTIVISDYAFSGHNYLTSITIPDSLTSIGNYAFYGCDSLTCIRIPNSVTSIGDWAFSDCSSLSNITVDENNEAYKSIDGNLYTKDCTVLIQYAIGKSEMSFTIPDSVTSIKNNAFYNCNLLKSITISDSVTSIGDYAFAYCSSLTSVTIPDSVTSIGDYAFYYCRSLTSVTIGDSVTSIGNGAFEYCTSLTSVTIGDSVTSIGDEAFYNCSSLTSIHYNGTKTQWYAISKNYDWNYRTGEYTIYCTDGNISK